MPKRHRDHGWSSSDCSESDAPELISVSSSRSRKRSRIHVKKSRQDDRRRSSSSDYSSHRSASSSSSGSSSSSSGSERSPRKRKRSKRKLRREISREIEKQLLRWERSCSVVSNRSTNRCASAKASRSPSVEIMWENVDNSLPNATRNTSSGYGTDWEQWDEPPPNQNPPTNKDSSSNGPLTVSEFFLREEQNPGPSQAASNTFQCSDTSSGYGTDWEQWDEPPPNQNPPTNKDSSSNGPLTVSEFFLREEQNPGPSQAASNTSNVYALDYLCEAFDCGFINKAENMDRVFRENMPVVQQLLIGATVKVLQHGYSIYFNIADVMIPDAETDKLLHHPGKQQFGNKQYYKNWPYLVKNKDDVTEGCFPIETVYLVKD